MGTTKQIKITNRTYYFYDDMVNIKDFDPNLLKLDKKSFKNIGVYYIGYITQKDQYKIGLKKLMMGNQENMEKIT